MASNFSQIPQIDAVLITIKQRTINKQTLCKAITRPSWSVGLVLNEPANLGMTFCSRYWVAYRRSEEISRVAVPLRFLFRGQHDSLFWTPRSCRSRVGWGLFERIRVSGVDKERSHGIEDAAELEAWHEHSLTQMSETHKWQKNHRGTRLWVHSDTKPWNKSFESIFTRRFAIKFQKCLRFVTNDIESPIVSLMNFNITWSMQRMLLVFGI